MKNCILYLGLFLFLLWSCHNTQSRSLVVDWTTYRKAYSWLPKQRDSAFFYFSEVTANSHDSLPVAMAYNNMSVIQSDAGDYYGAQESLSSSLKFLDTLNKSNYSSLANDYNELGVNSASLKNYITAISYYKQALRFTQDTALRSSTYNNIANAYQEQKKYAEALVIYERLLRESGGKGIGYARRLTNFATTNWLANPHYNPAAALLKALHIRLQADDLWGLNSSYAHLSDYYRKSIPDSAIIYATKMLSVAQKLGSPDDELQAFEKLAMLAPEKESKIYFLHYTKINDSLQTARNASKNQFALIRYQVQKSKSDNLKLHQENTEKKYQLWALIIASALGSIIFAIWYHKRRKRLERDTQFRINETRLKTSQMVHDTVANDIYRIKKKVQYDPVLDKAWLLYNIDDVYERSRDISYDIIRSSDEKYDERIGELLKSFSSDGTKVILVGNNDSFWSKVKLKHKFELKYALQELMVNMKKHSQATNVVIKFEHMDGRCSINYYDDGIGFPKEMLPKNGLTNTGNRIKEMDGEITFDGNSGQGLLINILFPTI